MPIVAIAKDTVTGKPWLRNDCAFLRKEDLANQLVSRSVDYLLRLNPRHHRAQLSAYLLDLVLLS